MDNDQIVGATTKLDGKVKGAVGGMLGNSKNQTEGKANQISGQVQNTYESAKHSIWDGKAL